MCFKDGGRAHKPKIQTDNPQKLRKARKQNLLFQLVGNLLQQQQEINTPAKLPKPLICSLCRTCQNFVPDVGQKYSQTHPWRESGEQSQDSLQRTTQTLSCLVLYVENSKFPDTHILTPLAHGRLSHPSGEIQPHRPGSPLFCWSLSSDQICLLYLNILLM